MKKPASKLAAETCYVLTLGVSDLGAASLRPVWRNIAPTAFLPHRRLKRPLRAWRQLQTIGRCLRVRVRVRVSGRFRRRCGNFLPVRSVRPVRCFVAPAYGGYRCGHVVTWRCLAVYVCLDSGIACALSCAFAVITCCKFDNGSSL